MMQAYLTLVRRELGSYFASIVGYVVMSVVMVLLGLSFSYVMESLNGESLDLPMTELFYNSYYFWFIVLLTTPMITMRSFAREKSTGTFETLMTAPVTDWTVVLAKFTGAFLFYLMTWLPLLGYVLVLRRFTNDPSAADPGIMASAFLGLTLVGALFVAIGCFASALTRNQIVAATVSFALLMGLFLTSFFVFLVTPRATWQVAFFRHVSLFEHMQDFVRGVVDSRAVVFYVTLTAWVLFITARVVESRRWK